MIELRYERELCPITYSRSRRYHIACRAVSYVVPTSLQRDQILE